MSVLPVTERHGRTLCPSGLPPTGAPRWIEAIDNPYLHGLFAPVVDEVEAEALPVEGQLPRDLFGAYVRNGPNGRFAPRNRYHWFDGDGMVHGIWFEDGTARYRNRWIATEGAQLELQRGEAIWPGVLGPFDRSVPLAPLKDTANTDLIVWKDRILALWYESGRPYALDPRTLQTVGTEDHGGELPARISAHSKVDPATGELVFFAYGDEPPYLQIGAVHPEGAVHLADIELPGPRRPHDLGVTPRYTIVHDFPVFFDPEHFARTGRRVPLFHREVPTRYGVLPRRGTNDDVVWFSFEPCYMLHVVNCWEEGDWVVMVGCRSPDPTLRPDPLDGKLAAMLSGLKLDVVLHEWRMNLATGEARERQLDDLNTEFPTIAPDMLGLRNRFSYHTILPHAIPATFEGLVRYDLTDGSTVRYDYGPGVFGSEAPFAPRPGATGEDDGYLVTFVTDVRDWSSAVWVFDAAELAAGPLAKVRLPQRVPAGFHATWVPGGIWAG